MNRERWLRIDEVFSGALERPEAEWAAFVADACGLNTELRREVEDLLDVHRAPGPFDGVVRDDSDGAERGTSDEADRRHRDRKSDDLLVGAHVGPYVVESVLGRGGMGAVYGARRADGHFDQEVALKVLPRGLASADLTTRFLAERQILARLTHPNVARLLDGGMSEGGYPYFAMELVAGVPLVEYCDREALSIADRLELFVTICRAVQFAHASLVVHRDLKPSNILVTADGMPKLLDFGIAKVLDPTALGLDDVQTRVGLRVLTPAYASPEQLRGEPVGTASDVYQLGILLYELLSGVHPWRDPAARRFEATGIEVTHPIRRPSAVVGAAERKATPAASTPVAARRLRGDLDAIVMKALRDEPERRYGSVEKLAEDVERHLAARPVGARADTAAYRTGKFVRRNAAPLSAAVAAVLGLVAFGAGRAREARRTAIQRDRAEEVTRFMAELFRSADPYVGGGSELTVRSLLDQGAERVRTEVAGSPLVQASLMDAIGDAYWELGEEEPGLALREDALRRWTDDPEASALDRASALARVGRMRASRGDAEGARSLLAEAERAKSGVRPEASFAWAGTLNDLGLARQVLGELDRAEPLLEEAVRMFLALPGGEASAAASLSNLAWLRQARSDPDSAEVLFKRALEARIRDLGPRHPSVANSLEGLGEFYWDNGRIEAADSAYRSALSIRVAVLEEDHPGVSRARVGLAQVLGARGENAEADRLFVEGLTQLESRLGTDHLSLGTIRNTYAIFLQRTGRLQEAAEQFDRAEQTYRTRLGAEHLSTATVAANAGWAHFLEGDVEGAVTRYRRAMPVLLLRAPDAVGTYGTLVDFGIVLCRSDEPEEAAEPLVRAAAELETRAAGSEAHLRALNALGSCLGALERFAESESILLEALGRMSERPRPDPYVSFATEALAATYEAWGRPDAARAVREGVVPPSGA